MNKYIFIVAEMDYANYFGALLPHTIKLFYSFQEVKKYIDKQSPYEDRYTIIKRKLIKGFIENERFKK